VTDDFAHNDYLQLLAELGLVGFAIGAALALSVVRIALRGALKCADPQARYFAVACIGALFAIGLHSLADFNLYIPANAMLLAWIAGMTVAVESWASWSVRPELGDPSNATERNFSPVLDLSGSCVL